MHKLKEAFNPEVFRKNGHELVDLMADYLNDVFSDQIEKAIPYIDPEQSLKYWREDFEDKNPNASELFKKVINNSTKLHHSKYMGHQVGVIAPIAALSSALSALLNNGMAVYEMGLASNPMERIITDVLIQKIGFSNSAGGFLTSGGTIANLTALLTARAKYTEVWSEGHTNQLGIMVSEEAHYCIDRAARIMGLGDKGIIKIPVNDKYQIRTDLLEEYYNKAKAQGIEIFCIVGSACSTSTGAYDDLVSLSSFAMQKNLWFHVDGAHGGAVLFSNKHKHLLEGLHHADSFILDWHKMMMIPALATSVIYKNGSESYHTFHQKAQYLWSDPSSQDWYNSGKRTMECTKLMMSLKIYSLLKINGESIIQEYVETTHDLAKSFYEILVQKENFEIAVEPQSNIVCFRLVKSGMSESELNELNSTIRKKLLQAGRFYIVQTTIKDRLYLRVSLMNPFTQIEELNELIEEIERLGEKM